MNAVDRAIPLREAERIERDFGDRGFSLCALQGCARTGCTDCGSANRIRSVARPRDGSGRKSTARREGPQREVVARDTGTCSKRITLRREPSDGQPRVLVDEFSSRGFSSMSQTRPQHLETLRVPVRCLCTGAFSFCAIASARPFPEFHRLRRKAREAGEIAKKPSGTRRCVREAIGAASCRRTVCTMAGKDSRATSQERNA